MSRLSILIAVLFAMACSSRSAAPLPILQHSDAAPSIESAHNLVEQKSNLKTKVEGARRDVGYYACPGAGQIEYLSNPSRAHSNVLVFAGKFAGQAPCGELVSGLKQPLGLVVDGRTHDLYVANIGGEDILVFHRGETTPYNTYIDNANPGHEHQATVDVAVTRDRVVIASNSGEGSGGGGGSISTWLMGAKGGTFVGHFPMPNVEQGGFVTVGENGTIYFNEVELGVLKTFIWSVSCPAGACGTMTQALSQPFNGNYGLATDAEGDLVVSDTGATYGIGSIETFELPNPIPSTFSIVGRSVGITINPVDQHLFVANDLSDSADEYIYPSGVFVGVSQQGAEIRPALRSIPASLPPLRKPPL